VSVIKSRPPNFDRILAAFPDADKPGVLFAYGSDIYFPDGGDIPAELLAHEAVHQRRQTTLFTPEQWWDLYLTDPGFRYHEELLAHVAEYKSATEWISDRNQRAIYLVSKARRLIAPLYNYRPPRSLAMAMTDINRELRK
jgi:hypothetical protein